MAKPRECGTAVGGGGLPVPGKPSGDQVGLTYGTLLANTQLTGVASTSGVFTYTSAARARLNAGNGQTASVTFTPTDSLHFTTMTSTVTLNIAKATPNVTSVTPVNITYGTVLSNTQLTGVASTPGVCSYTTAAGRTLTPGNGPAANVTFPPSDSADYTTAASRVTMNVAEAAVPVAASAAKSAYGGSPLVAGGTVTGAGGLSTTPTNFSYVGTGRTVCGSSTAPTNAGTYSVTASYGGDANHLGGSNPAVNFTIAQPTPAISVADAGGVYNAAAYAASGSGTGIGGTPLGTPTFAYHAAGDTKRTNPMATAPANVGIYVFVAAYRGSANYAALTVTRPTLAITQASSTFGAAAVTVAYGGTPGPASPQATSW